MSNDDSSKRSRARYLPLVIGALVLGVGLALGLSQSTEESPLPAPSASELSAADAAAGGAPTFVDEDPPYEPDLSGPDVGEVVVASAELAHRLVIAAGRIVWLATDAATVASARLDGGDAKVLFASRNKEAFGGSMAASPSGIWWSVEQTADQPEPIFFAPASALGKAFEVGEPVARGSSPDHLVASQADLWWSDLGAIMRLSGGQVDKQQAREQRVVALTVWGEHIYWLEAPYRGVGDHSLMAAPAGGGEAGALVAKLAPVERDHLLSDGKNLYWAAGGERGPHALFSVPRTGATPKRLVRTGFVTAMALLGGRLVWSEAHGEGDATVSVLRSATVAGEPRRLGRDRGHITALAGNEAHLFWSGDHGIKRLGWPQTDAGPLPSPQ